jgi:alkylation response protein AidB-like acyl-CoA dehydrogenase
LVPTAGEEYGGVGGDFRYCCVVDEEISRAGHSGLGFVVHCTIVVPYLLRLGSEAQKQKYLPGCISGEIVAAIAMTEPGTGSDLQGIGTKAEADGKDWVVNGSKTFITNGQQADLVVVVCKTNPEDGPEVFSLILVEAGTPGFVRGNNLEKVGLKSQDTSELFFENVRVPKENLLGEEGRGFIHLMEELPQERLSIAIGSMSVCGPVLEHTVNYVKERMVFGKPLSTLQNTQFKLAELDAQITAMRVFVDHCLALHLERELDTATASKAKLLVTELQGRVVDECVQLHGGFGFMWEYPVARAYADARVSRIYGGTSEVMKIIISRALLSA